MQRLPGDRHSRHRLRFVRRTAFAKGLVYIGGVGARLKAWQVLNGRMSAEPVAKSATAFGYPGTSPAVSSNGGFQAIVWALDVSGYASGDPAVLHAYWAYNLSELYNSAQAPRALRSNSPSPRLPMARSTSARRPSVMSTGYCRRLPRVWRRAAGAQGWDRVGRYGISIGTAPVNTNAGASGF